MREGGEGEGGGVDTEGISAFVRVQLLECVLHGRKKKRGGKRVPEGDHPGRGGGGRRTGRGKVRLMMLG